MKTALKAAPTAHFEHATTPQLEAMYVNQALVSYYSELIVTGCVQVPWL